MSDLNIDKLTYLRLLLNVDKVGPSRILRLINKFKEPEQLFNASIGSLLSVDGIYKNLAGNILKSIDNFPSVKSGLENELEKLHKLNGNIITYWDDDYPSLLKKIFYPPIILYTLGNKSDNDKYSIAMVGTRQPTTYGKIQAERFAGMLAEKNITVVSGLARGIDSISHSSTLKKGGRTIAVIGSGLDVIYPAENKKLFNQITENGMIYSEFPMGTQPDAQNFPKRNRIIAGLSLGTIIVETKMNGGAMQTAAHALDQNREVFAVPGNLGVNQSEGTNSLIQRGEAKLITNVEDVLIELELKLKPMIGKNIPKPSVDLNLFEEKIIQQLDNEPKHIDNISKLTSINTSDCLVHLLTLEFKGLVKQFPGKMFAAV